MTAGCVRRHGVGHAPVPIRSWTGRSDVASYAGHWLLSERYPASWRDLFEGPMGLTSRMRVREFVMGLAILCSSNGSLGDDVMASRVKVYSELVRGAPGSSPSSSAVMKTPPTTAHRRTRARCVCVGEEGPAR